MMYRIYDLLERRLPRPLAITICSLWYSALILTIVVLSFEPKADFRYLNL